MKKHIGFVLTVIIAAILAVLFIVIRLDIPFSFNPEIRKLQKQEVAQTDEGHQEYYFGLLDEEERRCYREILNGIRSKEEKFYLSISDGDKIDRVYHAVLKDHPEIYWVHNREQVFKTTYTMGNYCQLSPGYTYSEEECVQIDAAMEQAYQQVFSLIPQDADDYEKAKTAYTWLIDNVEYVVSEHDQSIAGAFWKRQAVCAGYAGAMQYLMERLEVPCIYVEGSARDSAEGHAWNILQLDGDYYYVDVTNGDQPDFLEGDAVLYAEHKTTIYDYLCPFPEEYEGVYTPSQEFPIPACTATARNFYVMNQACFDVYDWQSVYELCKLRIDNGAAVIRFKFSSQDAFQAAYEDCIENGKIQDVSRYYMDMYGMDRISYHYGILENLKTMYYMF